MLPVVATPGGIIAINLAPGQESVRLLMPSRYRLADFRRARHGAGQVY